MASSSDPVLGNAASEAEQGIGAGVRVDKGGERLGAIADGK